MRRRAVRKFIRRWTDRLTVFSASLCLLAICFWLFNWNTNQVIRYTGTTDRPTITMVGGGFTGRGEIQIGGARYVPTPGAAPVDPTTYYAVNGLQYFRYPTSPAAGFVMHGGPVHSFHHGRLDVGYRTIPSAIPGLTVTDFWCSAPTWSIAALLAVLPGLICIRSWRALGGPGPGQCPKCGYDLRMTPGRCPECGASPAALAAFQKGRLFGRRSREIRRRRDVK